MIIGIDTGVSGGMALYDEKAGVLVDCCMTPFYWQRMSTKSKSTIDKNGKKVAGKYKRRRKLAYWAIADKLETWREMGATNIIIEQVNSMPNQSSQSMFTFGESLGCMLGMAAVLGFDITLVRPKIWKSVYDLTNDKNESLVLARKTFGLSHFPTAVFHNVAEAALIAASGIDLHDAVLGGSGDAEE